VQPSSLIFLVIIAIWAAYLLQHWVRRREHLATARSVDRFSDAMRVLERRAPQPETTLNAPQPRSYAVSPARPARPEVVVKRPQTSARPTPRPASPAPGMATSPVPRRTGSLGRRLRGLSFLGSLVVVVVAVPLAAFGVLAWWTVVAALATVVADLAWLRHAARTERARRRAASAGTRPVTGHSRHTPRPAAHATGLRAPGTAPLAPESGVPTQADPAGRTGLVTTATEPGAWQPVPVPPPTYTLKARAAQPQPPSSSPAPVPVPAGSSFGAVVAEGELDGLLDRRRAAGA